MKQRHHYAILYGLFALVLALNFLPTWAARNGSGTYTVPNTFSAGTTITASGHNTNWSDLATELTNSVAADGQTPMTGALKGFAGTVSLPGYSFNADTDTGMYRHGANELGFATGGTLAGWFDSAQKFWALGALDVAGLSTFTGVATFASTSHMALPSGNTAARPGSPAAGMFRYNSQTGNPEFYNTAWNALLVTLSGAQMSSGAIINGTVAESNAANAAQFCLKTLAGTDPSSIDPVLVAFRNATATTGNYVYRTVTAQLCLTIPSGQAVGTSNNIAFRLWVTLFDDAGTIRMGVINCLSGTNIYPLGQFPLASSTAIATAPSAQVFYTGAAVTSKAYAVLGYAEYGPSVIAIAGTWNASPTRIQMFGPGVPLPGSRVQSVYTSTTTVGSTTSATFADLSSGYTLAINITSAANLVEVTVVGSTNSLNNGSFFLQLLRGSTAIGFPVGVLATSNATNTFPISLRALDAPNATGSTTYKVQGKASGGNTLNFPAANSGADLSLHEIMSALPEPANDNINPGLLSRAA